MYSAIECVEKIAIATAYTSASRRRGLDISKVAGTAPHDAEVWKLRSYTPTC